MGMYLWALHYINLFGGTFGDVILYVEGMAIDPNYQRKSLGSSALRKVLAVQPQITAVASTSRNPGVPRRMQKAGCVLVSPDPDRPDDPLHHYRDDPLVQDITFVVADAVGADITHAPYIHDKYGDGLYGERHDPGACMPLPTISNHPGNAIIVVATDIQRGEP